MRLREPFQGYKLSSGHFMFHMAYIVGSQIAVNYVLDHPFDRDPVAYDVLLQLNLAHICTPILNLLSLISSGYECHVLEKLFDTVSIFQYQATIFYA